MSLAITFDTHELVKSLRDAGFEEKQAEALTLAFRKAQEARPENLVTQQDLAVRLAELKVDLVKWMAGMFIAQSALLIGAMFAFLRGH
ncbi:MAG: DUF1640 domain-containing protein [Magnetococcales bacterium]|nr:DUF1640 domain-containing protein [Magnetococcales bacterium]MBF0157375.1 DUF1640 domain-containing protein [Magnetococcales bacterium]